VQYFGSTILIKAHKPQQMGLNAVILSLLTIFRKMLIYSTSALTWSVYNKV